MIRDTRGDGDVCQIKIKEYIYIYIYVYAVSGQTNCWSWCGGRFLRVQRQTVRGDKTHYKSQYDARPVLENIFSKREGMTFRAKETI